MNHLLLSSLLFISLLGRHDFHVSIINGELNPATGNLELSLKVFSNDLEEALADERQVNAVTGANGVALLPDSVLADYIAAHLQLYSGNHRYQLEYIGQEKEQDITFIYLQLGDFTPVKELSVRNTLFFNRFEDQSNIVNIVIGDKLESVFLEAGTPMKTLRY